MYFFHSSEISAKIAKRAVQFQSIITGVIGILLLLTFANSAFALTLLKSAVYLDCAFVILHLTYRKLYNGPKIVLKQKEKPVLVIHVVSSLLALILTLCIIESVITLSLMICVGTILVWLTSLSSGILFYRKKYQGY